MNKEKQTWNDTINDIDDRFVIAAAKPPKIAVQRALRKWTALAACVALLFFGGWFGVRYWRQAYGQGDGSISELAPNWDALSNPDAPLSFQALKESWKGKGDGVGTLPGGLNAGTTGIIGLEEIQKYQKYCQTQRGAKEDVLEIPSLEDWDRQKESIMENSPYINALLSLEEAEFLLVQGCVLGGHICPSCIESGNAPDFSSYDAVGWESRFLYLEENTEYVDLPFYVFYKILGDTENGDRIYGKLYVPAFEVSGLEEYCQQQEHPS